MMGTVFPFAATAEQAWDAYQALNDEALADQRLLFDADHAKRRADAHELFALLFRRECEREAGVKVRRA